MDRDPLPSDFIGKTITRFDASCINIWRIGFSDGTAIAIEIEGMARLSTAHFSPVFDVASPLTRFSIFVREVVAASLMLALVWSPVNDAFNRQTVTIISHDH